MSPNKKYSKIHFSLLWVLLVPVILSTILIWDNTTSYHRLNQFYITASPRKARDVDSVSVLLSNNARWNYFVADTYFKMGLYEKAVDYYQKTIQLNPLGKTFINMGDCYLEESNWPNALLCYERAESMLPAYATPVYRQFEIYCELGDSIQAKLCAERLLTKPIKIESNQIKQMKATVREYRQ